MIHNLGSKRWFSSEADYIFTDPPNTISLSSTSNGERRDVLTAYSNMDPYDLISIIDKKNEVESTIGSHVKWDNEKGKYLIKWMDLLTSVDNRLDILNQRLERIPGDIYSLRAFQDQADSIQRTKLCKELEEKSKITPDDSDLYYLSCRCIENELERDNAFVSGYRRWENNSWLSFASAYVYTERMEWKNAYLAFEHVATENPSLREKIADDAERVRRILKNKFVTEEYAKPLINSENVSFSIALEEGNLVDQEQNPNNAFYLMSKGEIANSRNFIKNYTNYEPFVLRLLAVSKGANKEIIQEALDLTIEDGVNYNTIWSALGLAINKKNDTEPYLNLINDMGINSKSVKDFVESIERSDYKKIEDIIADVDFITKAHLYTLGCIILKDRAPKSWLEYVESVLHINERPFM